MTSLTTIIFIPGAWHNPDCFNKVISPLKTFGYSTDVVHLPSVGPSTPHLDFSEDVLYIRNKIQAAVVTGQKVVLVVHSYGGLPASEAVQGLDWETRQRNGQPGGVIHVFFCCSFLVPVGESLLSAFGGNDLPWFQVSSDRRLVTPATPEQTFYNDLPEEEVRLAAAALKPHSYMTLHSKLTYAAWKHVPSTYLYCEKDEAIPLSVQRMMVEEIASGIAIRTETVNASHSPFLSVPGDVVFAIRRAAGEEV